MPANSAKPKLFPIYQYTTGNPEILYESANSMLRIRIRAGSYLASLFAYADRGNFAKIAVHLSLFRMPTTYQ